MLSFMGSQKVRHDLGSKQQQPMKKGKVAGPLVVWN